VNIAIVDYGAGNLASVKKAFDALGTDALITSDPEQIASADKIVVPGVGHFATTAALNITGARRAVEDAIACGRPVLGICLGMQWMFQSSSEATEVEGLGLFSGQCKRFAEDVKAPHVGWNELAVNPASRLFRGIGQGAFVYFTHSYRAPIVEQTVATCEYGGVFSAAVEQGLVFGVQFHPEKSGAVGRKLLENFCGLPC
jgi:imidazole glycerol-phosphate synthase subunit HisH